MEQNFKYPLLRTFFDVDNILCVFVEDVINAYPNINKLSIQYRKNEADRKFNTFCWDISISVDVMAFDDLKLFISLYDEVCEKLDVIDLSGEYEDYESITKCSVCGELLLSDDYAYGDEISGESLCDKHSVRNEETSNYVKYDDDKDFIYEEGISTQNEKALWFNGDNYDNHIIDVNFYSLYMGTTQILYDDEMNRRPYIIINNTITYLDILKENKKIY